MRIAILTAAVLLTGCAAEHASNWEICKYSMGGIDAAVAQREATRRGLDCAPYYPAIVQQRQAESNALNNAAQFFNRPAPMIPFPTQRQCRSIYKGHGIYDTVCD